jgi:pilus assembly protein FimV
MVMVVAAGGAAALSLGNPQGTVVLGRPLDLVFDVRTDGTDVSDACVTAKVTAGDDPISQSQISVTPLPNAAGRSASVRLRSSQPINEPVIDVRLSAGCSGSVVRTYTVLAYPAEALSASQASAERTSAAAAPLVLRSTLTPDAAGARDGVRTRSGAVPADQVVTQRLSRVERAVKPAVARKPELEPGRPRLVMEPLSDWLQAPSVLRASTEMAALPESTSPSLREEAAARWRALNMQSEDLLQEDARRAAQDKAQSEKLAAAERDKEAALAVQQELQERAAARFPANLVYALLALLVALAALLAWVWKRRQGLPSDSEQSWTHGPAKAATSVAPAGVVRHVADEHDVTTRPQPAEPEMLPSGMMPLEFGTSADAPEPASAASSLQAAAPAPVTAVLNPEDLFDLQQQAEFFVSVGEHDQAIEVMKKHIEANQSASPSAYLELLRLYRSLSRIEQFNELRAQFHRYFNAQVPEFAAFARPGRTLFGYPDVLARIEALWCDPSVVPMLQELLFRGQGQDQRFDLPAYDDLLLLHAVARTTPASARGQSAPRRRTTPLEAAAAEEGKASATATGPDPASNLMEFEPDWDFDAQAAASRQAAPAPGAPMEIDLDLSDLTHLDALAESGEISQPLPFLTQQEVPAVASTPPPAPNQPVGFGVNSDRFEARVDPDERKPR